MADKIRRTDSYQQIIDDLEKCSKGSPCADCSQPTKWNCDWMLMLKAKNALIELLHLHYLDKSEIVRLRRQIEVLQMGEEEKTIIHCNNEENAKIIATLLDMDADGHYLTYSSIFGEEEEPAPPKEGKIS